MIYCSIQVTLQGTKARYQTLGSSNLSTSNACYAVGQF